MLHIWLTKGFLLLVWCQAVGKLSLYNVYNVCVFSIFHCHSQNSGFPMNTCHTYGIVSTLCFWTPLPHYMLDDANKNCFFPLLIFNFSAMAWHEKPSTTHTHTLSHWCILMRRVFLSHFPRRSLYSHLVAIS